VQKLIRVSINETGGEFTCGTIESDQGDLIEEIRNKIDDGDISSYCELENGDDFDAVIYDNKFHIYGKHTIFSESCEGKGEWENDFLKIVDSSEETLYENGDY